jgi:hypothetical protein
MSQCNANFYPNRESFVMPLNMVRGSLSERGPFRNYRPQPLPRW